MVSHLKNDPFPYTGMFLCKYAPNKVILFVVEVEKVANVDVDENEKNFVYAFEYIHVLIFIDIISEAQARKDNWGSLQLK